MRFVSRRAWIMALGTVAAGIALCVTGCEGGAKKTDSSLVEADYAAMDSLMGTIHWVLNAAEDVSVALAPALRFRKDLTMRAVERSIAPVVHVGCPTSVTDCSGKQRSLLYDADGGGTGDDGCERAGRKLFGTVVLDFGLLPVSGVQCPSTTASFLDILDQLDNGSGVTLTTTNFKRVNKNGYSVDVSSDAYTAYTHASVGGGVRYEYLRGADDKPNFLVTVLGLHRIYRNGSDAIIHDHSIKTTELMTVVGALRKLGTTRVLSGGKVSIFLNDISATASVEFTSDSGLTWNYVECCYPTSGKVTMNFEGELTGTATLDLGPLCGAGSFTGVDGHKQAVELVACE